MLKVIHSLVHPFNCTGLGTVVWSAPEWRIHTCPKDPHQRGKSTWVWFNRTKQDRCEYTYNVSSICKYTITINRWTLSTASFVAGLVVVIIWGLLGGWHHLRCSVISDLYILTKMYNLNALHCKLLWIKASAKCINVNEHMNMNVYSFFMLPTPWSLSLFVSWYSSRAYVKSTDSTSSCLCITVHGQLDYAQCIMGVDVSLPF